MLFDVSSYPALRQARPARSTEEMIAGARVEVAPYKEESGRFRALETVDAGAARLGPARGAAAVRAGTSSARR